MSDLRISFPSPCSESWDEMRPSGCNRFCSTCSETIYDLSELTTQEAETLLRAPGKHCVRAQIINDALVLKPGRSGSQRRIMVAVGASIGLLASACETVPQASSPTGVILGEVEPPSGVNSVKAVSEDGRTYRTKVHDDGSYRFKPLPYGSYTLTFVSDCGALGGDRVILQESEHPVRAATMTQECIVVGMVKFEDDHA